MQPEIAGGQYGARRFPLVLPCLHKDRSFNAAWLVLPPEFPVTANARIQFSPDAILRIPHVEFDGRLCIEGDPGPLSGAEAADRIEELLQAFDEKFLRPWCTGLLDGDFAKEALNYWSIQCKRHRSPNDAVKFLYTLDERQSHPRIYDAQHLSIRRVVIAGVNAALTQRTVTALRQEKEQVTRVLVADIPISHALTPHTWPQTQRQLERLLQSRFGRQHALQFLSATGRRGRKMHRIVLLRAPTCSFGFLLTGGPPTVVRRGITVRAYPTQRMVPLPVERMDPAWICGRDQHPEITLRQRKRVLILGAGALGSPLAEQLTKAGVGELTLVDPEQLATANIGRHVLGANAIDYSKAGALGRQLARGWPSTEIKVFPYTAQTWLTKNHLDDIDLVLDLTGEPAVRSSCEAARRTASCPLLVGWMEPYAAAAHACLLPLGSSWLQSTIDPMRSLEAIDWPDAVIQQEPACSSTFQSYTPSAAAYAVALIAEGALALLDDKINVPVIRSWVRGRKFLDDHYVNLAYRPWAEKAAPFDGVSLQRAWHG